MRKREKSARYPAATWNECKELIRKISLCHTKTISYQEVAKQYGLSSTTTKSFTSKIGAARQFGLIITTKGKVIQLTDTGNEILSLTNDAAYETELSCFAQAPLYKKLIDRFDGSELPTRDELANILMNEYKITRSVKDSAAKCFFDSAEQLGIISDNVLCYSHIHAERERDFNTMVRQISEDADGKGQNIVVPEVPSAGQISTSKKDDSITQMIPFTSGKNACFSIPADATEDDLLILHDIFEVFLRRKFKIDI